MTMLHGNVNHLFLPQWPVWVLVPQKRDQQLECGTLVARRGPVDLERKPAALLGHQVVGEHALIPEDVKRAKYWNASTNQND